MTRIGAAAISSTHRPSGSAASATATESAATAGHTSAFLDVETTRLLLADVPAAYHAGVQDILLIAFALAWHEFLGDDGVPIGIDVEGHGRDETLAPGVDLTRTVGWFTAKYPVSLAVGGLSWPPVLLSDGRPGTLARS